MKEFIKNEDGSVVQWILILAVIFIIGAYAFPRTQFYAKYYAKQSEKQREIGVNGDKAVSPSSTPPSDPSSYYYVKGGVDGILSDPTILLSEKEPIYFNKNNNLSFKAVEGAKTKYEPTKPYSCKWENYLKYTGNYCDPKEKRVYGLGEHTVKVRMCDAVGACANAMKNFTVMYEPLASQIQRDWVNYIKNGGASGEWKYSTDTQTMYSTKNVGWTGYWNPKDAGLDNYELTYQMAVKPSNDDDALGMTFRMKDTNNMYILSIDKRTMNGGVGGFHSGIYKLTNGRKTRLVDLMPLAWQPNDFKEYKIRVKGNNIQVFYNGSKIADVIDSNSPHLTGGWGPFSISQAHAVFKDINFEHIK